MLKFKVIGSNTIVSLNNILAKLSILNLIASNSSVVMSFKDDKDKYMKMSIDEKRKHYSNSNIITLDKIKNWNDYRSENNVQMCSKMSSSDESNEIINNMSSKISMWQGDITCLEIDAIVNAANSNLLGGGGVDGAIHRAAGPNLKKECATLGGCRVGDAKITGGYKLPAKYVIHTVGPRGEKPEKLRECYFNCLNIAKENGIRTIAFPCISTGVYGYPQRPAAEIALTTVKKYLQENSGEIDRIIFCLFLKTDKDIYEELLEEFFG